jgi:hypothetical protein
MPAEIVTAEFCAQYYATFDVPSSDGKQMYTVTLNGGEGMPHCTCQGFKFRHGCKHIDWVWKHGCLWNPQWKDGGPNDIPAEHIHLYEGYPLLDGPCPACGGKTVPVRIAV